MRRFLIAVLLSAPGLAALGCESDNTGPGGPLNVVGTTELNASSNTQFVYFSLASGSVVTVASPKTSSDWDLAVRRYEVRLNGGAVGPKNVSGFNLANNAAATPQQILAFTPDNQQAAFAAVGTAELNAAGAFTTETLTPNPLGWLAFGAQGPVANSQAWKVRRTAGGGYALFRVTGLTIAGATPQTATVATITVDYRYQPAGGTLGTKGTVILDRAAGTGAIDLSTGTAVAGAAGCGWDLKVNADFSVVVNTACNVATAPLDASENFDALTHADDALGYGAFLAGLSGAVPFTTALDDPRGPFLYNLAGDNRLSPTYNIYLVKVGTAVYKIQLIGYYSATGVSGFPTIRYARIQ
ncbi:MAG TPA: HmuY family protein [Gemmatimonadales bacterium]|jgi:hypothetical protein|nr:HmuY family protein [Gemmatimonadales bacterium]